MNKENIDAEISFLKIQKCFKKHSLTYEKSDYEIIDLEQRVKGKIKEILKKEFNDIG